MFDKVPLVNKSCIAKLDFHIMNSKIDYTWYLGEKMLIKLGTWGQTFSLIPLFAKVGFAQQYMRINGFSYGVGKKLYNKISIDYMLAPTSIHTHMCSLLFGACVFSYSLSRVLSI